MPVVEEVSSGSIRPLTLCTISRPVSTLLADLDWAVVECGADTAALYDRLAPRYEAFRGLWLRLAGGGAERAMLEDLRAVLRPGQRVLDAGCGTGALSRRVLELEPDIALTMLDLSPGMLAQAEELPAERIVGSVLALPFADETFDVVISGWVIETVADPLQAVREYRRVIRPDGHVLYTFCSLPDGWVSRAGTAWLRRAVKSDFAGNFLEEPRIPWHDCERSHRRRTRAGLATEIVIRKCCPIGSPLFTDA